jgi:hypothetical protein
MSLEEIRQKKEELLRKLSEVLARERVCHKDGREGTIASAEYALGDNYVAVEIDFAGKSSWFSYPKAYEASTLGFCDSETSEAAISLLDELKAVSEAEREAEDEEVIDIAKDFEKAKADWLEREKVKAEQKRKKTPGEKAASRLAKQTAGLEKQIEDVESNPIDYSGGQLEWIESHLISIRASMPARLQSWFDSQFPDCPNDAKYIIPDDRLTSGGYKMSWGLGLVAYFDEDVPFPQGNGKTVSNNAFVWDLVVNKGFGFGKN